MNKTLKAKLRCLRRINSKKFRWQSRINVLTNVLIEHTNSMNVHSVKDQQKLYYLTREIKLAIRYHKMCK